MNRYATLLHEVKLRKPSSIMEIGTWNGEHASQMIMEALFFSPKVTYIGFDLFAQCDEEEFCPKKPAKIDDVYRKLSAIPRTEIILIEGNTRETIAQFEYSPVDFIFIDGGHSLQTIESDWLSLQRFIKKDTVIIFDDYYMNKKDKGCWSLITHLQDFPAWQIDLLHPIDEVNNLQIRLAKVRSINAS